MDSESPHTSTTREDVRRADHVADDMDLESQNLTDEALQKGLRRMVELRLSAEARDGARAESDRTSESGL